MAGQLVAPVLSQWVCQLTWTLVRQHLRSKPWRISRGEAPCLRLGVASPSAGFYRRVEETGSALV